MKRYNLFIEDHVISRLRVMAKSQGTTTSDLIRSAVDKMLSPYVEPTADPAPTGPDHSE